MKILRTFLCFLVGFLALLLHTWSAGAIYYCSIPFSPALRTCSALIYLLSVILFIILRRKHTQAFFVSLLGFLIIAIWFSSIQPKKGGVYPPELTLPFADFNGDMVTVHTVRNNDYRAKDDFDVRYEARNYNLNDLNTVDIFVNYWGMEQIAHTFISFGFKDGQYLAVSIEIRPEVGEAYDMFAGFFKQYELIYVWGDERDLVRGRSNYRGEDVYLYRSKFNPEQARRLLVHMLERTNSIKAQPVFYNTATQSCTNTLGNHVNASGIAKIPFWRRRLRTGDVDKRLYEDGYLDTSIPFAELRKNAFINERAKAADKDPHFSQKIRTHLF